MVIDWDLFGGSRATQRDKDLAIGELDRRFGEWIQLRKAVGPAVDVAVSAMDPTERNTDATHQKCAAGILDGEDPTRQWRYRYEEWPLWRNDLGWKTQKRNTWKQNMGNAHRDDLPYWGASNRFQTLS